MEFILPNVPAFLAGIFVARTLSSATLWGLSIKMFLIIFVAINWVDAGISRPQGDVSVSVIASLLYGVLSAWIGYGVRRTLFYGPATQRSIFARNIVENPGLLLDPKTQHATDEWSKAYQRELDKAKAQGLEGQALIAEAKYQVCLRADRQKILDVIFGGIFWLAIIGGIVWLVIHYLML